MRVNTASGAHARAMVIAHGTLSTGSKLANPPGGAGASTGRQAYSPKVPSSVSASGRVRSAARSRTAVVASCTRVVTSRAVREAT